MKYLLLWWLLTKIWIWSDRYSDSEAARVKSASRLVGGIAASTLNLQDGIANMAGESPALDEHYTTPHHTTPYHMAIYTIHSSSSLPIIFLFLVDLISFAYQLFSTVMSWTAMHHAGCHAQHCTPPHNTVHFLISQPIWASHSSNSLSTSLLFHSILFCPMLQLTARHSLWC